MKTKSYIVLGIIFFSVVVNEAHAICAAETLEWWEACNDTRFANALPLNPVLMSVMFVVGISSTGFAGILIWRKRR